jgi:hypothetical protein
MPTLDELIDDNIVPKDNPQAQMDDVEKTLTDDEVPHQSTQVFHGVDRVHNFPNMESIENTLLSMKQARTLIAALEKSGCISQHDLGDVTKVFGEAVLEELPLSGFSSIPSKTNFKPLLRFVKETMADDQEKMKSDIRESLNTFLEVAYDLHTNHDEISDTLSGQINAVVNLITATDIRGSKDRIIYVESSDAKTAVDMAKDPLSLFLPEDQSAALTKILSDDLLLFISQVRTSSPPSSSFAELTESIASIRNDINLIALQEFYTSPNIYPSLSMLFSYIDRAVGSLEETIKNNEEGMFDIVTTGLPELNEVVKNLRYSHNVLNNMAELGPCLMAIISTLQKKIAGQSRVTGWKDPRLFQYP